MRRTAEDEISNRMGIRAASDITRWFFFRAGFASMDHALVLSVNNRIPHKRDVLGSISGYNSQLSRN